jgi:2-hydroxychromene-2-carboxylate isomerase
MPKLDFWYDLASSYSYLAAMRIETIAANACIDIRWRPFLLGPIFKTQGWVDSPFNLFPAKGRYMLRDLERTCAAASLPFRLPNPFPQRSITAARITLVALDEGWGIDFTKRAFSAEFGEGRDIGERGVPTSLIAELGHDPERVLSLAESPDNKDRLRSETDAAQKLGIFGAPSFVTEDGELFWGNDRLEAALAWARHREAAR